MAVNIVVPSVGESVTEGTVSRWLKPDGAAVRADEPVVELETEKATTPVAAPVSGRLVVAIKEGETVKIGQVVGRVEEGPVPVAEAKPKSEPSKPTAAPTTPAARHHATEAGVDVRQVVGSGRGGRVLKEDIVAHAAKNAELPPSPPKPATTAPRETRQRLSPIRQRIAERLVAAQHTAAILTTFNEADMTAVQTLRTKYKDAFAQKHGTGLGYMAFFVKASVAALRAYPAVNARIDGSEVVYHSYCHVGVAVSTERGLMVPVVRDAQDLSFAAIEKRIADLADAARQGKISVDDLQGGTFTITNGGVFGSLLSTPLLNLPQTGILGMHAIQKRPVVVTDQIVIRPMMYLALSYDHRLIDGREAVGFLNRVKECIEDPERLLLDV